MPTTKSSVKSSHCEIVYSFVQQCRQKRNLIHRVVNDGSRLRRRSSYKSKTVSQRPDLELLSASMLILALGQRSDKLLKRFIYIYTHISHSDPLFIAGVAFICIRSVNNVQHRFTLKQLKNWLMLDLSQLELN